MKTYYVYLLTDPRNNHEVFYCGKGHGDRWKSHLGHWSGNGKNNPTENKIKNKLIFFLPYSTDLL